MATLTLNPLLDSRWEAFVQSHPRASVFHSARWLRALQQTYGYEPIAFTTDAPDAPLTNAIVFCRVNSWATGERLVSLPFSDHCDPLVNDPETEQKILSLVLASASAHSKYIELRSRATSIPSEFVPGDSFWLHALDVRGGEDQLLAGFHKDCVRRKIQRAAREELTYEEGTSDRLLADFSRLLLQSRRRQQLPPQPASWYRNLIDCMGDALKIRVAYKRDQAIASILTLRYRDTLVYKYGCSDPAFNNAGGMVLLLWKTIQEASRDGLRELDLGRSDLDNEGLVTFKDRWGATRTRLTYWRHPETHKSPARVSGWKQRVAGRMFQRMPDALLVACGRLLYRHIG
jgi:lipid II:glycine glycyltransferase (peptidoglycan interpeptide bridge formation enzyme)